MTKNKADTCIPRTYICLSILFGLLSSACSSGGLDTDSTSSTGTSSTGTSSTEASILNLTTNNAELTDLENSESTDLENSESTDPVSLGSANPDSSGFGKVVTFDWVQADVDDQGYNVFYESESGGLQLAVQVAMSDLIDGVRVVQFDLPTDATLPDGTACFTVSAWSSFGETAQSEVVCADV